MEDRRQSEESYFSELVKKILLRVIEQMNVPIDAINDAIEEIIASFRGFPFRFHEINLSELKCSCAYFYRYGAHGAGLTRCKVFEALQNCVDLYSKFKTSTTLNIVSIGGGPGNDIIGLCSALWEIDVRGKNLNFCITDIHEWSLYVDLLQGYIRGSCSGNSSEFFHNNNTTMTFLRAPLDSSPEEYFPEEALREEYLNALENADVVLMVKVLSIIEIDEKRAFVESIYEGMKKDAFLIFIDSPFDGILFSRFQNLYTDPHIGDEENRYISSVTPTGMGLYDHYTVSSKAGVVVLRK